MLTSSPGFHLIIASISCLTFYSSYSSAVRWIFECHRVSLVELSHTHTNLVTRTPNHLSPVPSLFSCCMVGSSRERISSAACAQRGEIEREMCVRVLTTLVMCRTRHFHDWTWLMCNWIKRKRDLPVLHVCTSSSTCRHFHVWRKIRRSNRSK